MAVRPVQEVFCSVGVIQKTRRKGWTVYSVLLVEMKTWRNRLWRHTCRLVTDKGHDSAPYPLEFLVTHDLLLVLFSPLLSPLHCIEVPYITLKSWSCSFTCYEHTGVEVLLHSFSIMHLEWIIWEV